jgi:ABC-type multidrug transport system fused ATPase/permease subunit
VTSAPAGSILAAVRAAVALLPSQIRRRLVLAIGLALMLAAMEAAAVGGLFSVINVLVDDQARAPGWGRLLAADDRDEFLVRAASLVLALFLLRSGLGFAVARLHAELHARTDAWLATTIFERALRYPYAEHLRRSSSEIMAVLNWCTADVAANLVGAAASASVDILVLTALAGTLIVLQPLSAVGMIAYFAVVAGVVLLGLTPAVRRAADDEYHASVLTHRSMIEGLHGVKAFQIAVATDVVADEHTRHRADLASARQRKVFLSAMSRQTLETAVTLGIGLLAAALFAFNSSTDALASLGLVVAVAFRALPSVSRLLAILNGMRSASVTLRKIQDELGQPTTHDDRIEQPPLPFHRDITFNGVSYTYGGGTDPALDDVTLRIPIGSSVGIVGRSGAGKTTMVDLLLGLLEPSSGAVEVDGLPLDRTNIRGWRRLIGYVPQEVFLLDGSVRDNVVFAGRDVPAPDDCVWAALEQAQLDTFVRSLPAGLDTMIGERGARLSGGQRQRIGIARALYREPSVLVLDEATSALDLVTEAAMAQTIRSLDRSITKVIIAHRLTTVRDCDRIVVLENARVAGVGGFDELAATVQDFQVLAHLSESSRPIGSGG